MADSPIHVTSEIAPLKKVLLQRPGKELEHLSPSTMDELLFDDIPYLHRAREEHDEFARLLRENGAEPVYLDELTSETLDLIPDLKDRFIEMFLNQAGGSAQYYRDALAGYLKSVPDTMALVHKMMAGISFREVFPKSSGSLSDRTGSKVRFLTPPMPNLYFTRDPFASIGSGVSLHRMRTETRCRETFFSELIFKHHPSFSGKVPFYYRTDNCFSLEGGDILNLSAKVLAVGVSARTQAEAVEILADNVLTDERSEIETVLAFTIPQTRACMHLDTVFTQVDREKFTIHPGIFPSLHVFSLKKGKGGIVTEEEEGSLENVLSRYLNLDKPELIYCGGNSPITAAREQWNDGSNTLCIAPGTVIVYDRNYETNRVLEDSGIRTLRLDGSELSRGRGGPRCMSMPLVRE